MVWAAALALIAWATALAMVRPGTKIGCWLARRGWARAGLLSIQYTQSSTVGVNRILNDLVSHHPTFVKRWFAIGTAVGVAGLIFSMIFLTTLLWKGLASIATVHAETATSLPEADGSGAAVARSAVVDDGVTLIPIVPGV